MNVKFDWRAFSENDFVEYVNELENELLENGAYCGCVRVGNLKLELYLISDEVPENEIVPHAAKAQLEIAILVGGIKPCKGYGRNGYPYDVAGNIRLSDSGISYPYEMFTRTVEEHIVSYLESADYSQAKLIEKAKEPLSVW